MQVKITSDSSSLKMFDFSSINKYSLGVKLVDNLDLNYKLGTKLKLTLPIKLEMHLRNSEVVAIPLIAQQLNNKIELKSHNLFKPLQGTQDNIFITLTNSDGGIIDEGQRIFNIQFFSKNYWTQIIKKNNDGLRTAPIEFLWYLKDINKYMLFNGNPESYGLKDNELGILHYINKSDWIPFKHLAQYTLYELEEIWKD